MKVALISFITHSSHLNYGATLHGYAFQRVLTKHNIDSRVIRYIPKLLKNKDNLKYPILNPRGGRSLKNWLLVKLNWIIGFRSNIRKYYKFQRFIDEHLYTTDKLYSYDELKNCTKVDNTDFDVFICEADIIWKFTELNSIDENFFLAFPAAWGKRKIAYAPTIASPPLSKEVISQIRELTSSFHSLSAREKKCADYLSQVLNRHFESVLDPTLLLNEIDYNELAITPSESDYLLVYNCTVNDIQMVRQAKKYARSHNLKIIEISNYALNRFAVGHKVLSDLGIEEWLGYFRCAKMIITNSFHGLCFSIIYKKPFFVYQRDNRDYRMQSIVEALGLTNHLVTCDNRTLPSINPSSIDYDSVYELLAKLRNASFAFIEDSLKD